MSLRVVTESERSLNRNPSELWNVFDVENSDQTAAAVIASQSARIETALETRGRLWRKHCHFFVSVEEQICCYRWITQATFEFACFECLWRYLLKDH